MAKKLKGFSAAVVRVFGYRVIDIALFDREPERDFRVSDRIVAQDRLMHRRRVDSEHLAAPLKTSQIFTRGKNPCLRSLLGVALVMLSTSY
jgi:hypothetical protein